MNTCPSTNPYTLNLVVDDSTKFSFNIHPQNNQGGDQTEQMRNKCTELGWSDPIVDKITGPNISFINQEMDSQTCFSNPDQKLKVIGNCYLHKSCDNNLKTIDYYCNQSIPNNLDVVSFDVDNPVPYQGFTDMSNVMNDTIDFTGNSGYIRCEEGYVFKQLDSLMDDKTEYSTALWVKDPQDQSSIWWLKPRDTPITNPTMHELSGECVPDKCKDTNITDSNYAYDPLFGNHKSEPITVKCNDGYIFNHDLLHQGGKVKCDYELYKNDNDNLWTKNNMNWYIHDDRLESLCNKHTNRDSCLGLNGLPTPTYDPYQFINTASIERKQGLYNSEVNNLYGFSGINIGCEWSPEIIDQSIPGQSITKQSQCSFRKKVDTSDKLVPICKPMKCPEKSIPNSDRSGVGTKVPLPGPNDITQNDGNCLTDTGDIIDVNNMNDCICQQHMSCNSCSSDDNCQWCGTKDSKFTPGCYSKNNADEICRSGAIKQGEGGSCTLNQRGMESNLKQGWNNLPPEQRTIGNCENEFNCINNDTNIVIPSSSVQEGDLSLDTIRVNYQINTNSQPPEGRDLCISYNNTWSSNTFSTSSSNDDYCFFKKNKVINNPNYRLIDSTLYMGLWNENNDPKLATTPHYCKPTDSNDSTSVPSCFMKNTFQSCVSDTKCEWTDNLLSESNVHWNYDNKNSRYNDIIKLVDSNNAHCFICNNNVIKGGPSPTMNNCSPIPTFYPGNLFKITRSDNNNNNTNYVELNKLDGTPVTIDPSVQGKCEIQYMDTSTFGLNNVYNLDHNLLQQINGTSLNPDNAITCIKPDEIVVKDDGFRYCLPSSGQTSCPEGQPFIQSPVLQNLGISNICNINPMTSCPSSYCFRTNDNDAGSPFPDINNLPNTALEEEFYSMSTKHMTGTSNNIREESCNNTYNTLTNTTVGNAPYDNRKFSTCRLPNQSLNNVYNKEVCNLVNKQYNGEDITHWGKYCVNAANNHRVPMKYVCESKGINYTWKESESQGTWEGRCYDISVPTNPQIISNSVLCDTHASPSNYYSSDETNHCIINVPNSINDTTITNLCEKWSVTDFISDNSFEYHVKPANVLDLHQVNRSGTCIIGPGRNQENPSNLGRLNKLECEYDNNDYHKRYTYDNTSFCPAGDINYQLDRKLTWTGGDIQSDLNDNWNRNCSSTILSSCKVNCDDNYGGGGIFTCHYNTHSEDVCKHVENTFNTLLLEETQRNNCESYPNCKYTPASPLMNSKCESIAVEGDDLIKGQAEWIGNKCYHLNNDAFSHGIYNLSTMDEIYPPLIRLIVFFFILIILAYLFRKTGIYEKILNLLLNIVNSGTRRTFTGTTKIIYDLIIGFKRFIKNIVLTPIVSLGKLSKFIITHFKKVIIGMIVVFVTFIILYEFYSDKLKFIFNGYTSTQIARIRNEFDQNAVPDPAQQNNNQETGYRKYFNPYYFLGFIIAVIIIRFTLTR